MIPAAMHLLFGLILEIRRISSLAIVALGSSPCSLVLVQDSSELLGCIGRVVIRSSFKLRFGLSGQLFCLDSILLGNLWFGQIRGFMSDSSNRLIITHWSLH